MGETTKVENKIAVVIRRSQRNTINALLQFIVGPAIQLVMFRKLGGIESWLKRTLVEEHSSCCEVPQDCATE